MLIKQTNSGPNKKIWKQIKFSDVQEQKNHPFLLRNQLFKLHSMWYCYLLSNQQGSCFGQQDIQTTINLPVNHQIISKYIENEYINLKSTSNAPLVLIQDSLPVQRPSQKVIPERRSKHFCEKQRLRKLQKDNLQIKGNVKLLSEVLEKGAARVQKPKVEENGKGKNPGRNSTSNIFRVFLKLCSKPKLEGLVVAKFKQIVNAHSLPITYEYFKLRLKELSPSTSNYVNVKEFKKLWEGDSQFSKAFRCLFHWFLNSFATNHCLTLRGKHKMMKESILHFLENLHQIQGELWETEKEETQIKLQAQEQESQKSNQTK